MAVARLPRIRGLEQEMVVRNRCLAAGFAAFLSATPALAACNGNDLIEAMPAAERAQIVARAAAGPFPEGLFWRAERGAQAFDIIGTLHISDPRHGPLMETAAPLVAAADVVFLEATPEDMAALEAEFAARPEFAYILEGPTLRDLLTPAEWDVYAAEMAARQVPGFLASQFQPWLAFTTLSIPPCLLALGAELDNGLDHRIATHAQALGVELRALEDPGILFEVFDALGPEFSLDMLRASLAQATRAEDLIATMANAYFAGQHRLIWEFSRTYMPPGFDAMFDARSMDAAFARMEEVFLVNRNRAWMGVLGTLPGDARAVVAVGAAHLSGPDGLLDLLAKAGYALTRLDG
jgi:uncharacterized protein YbaP (TraB family)